MYCRGNGTENRMNDPSERIRSFLYGTYGLKYHLTRMGT